MNLLVALWMLLSGPGQPELHQEYFDDGGIKMSYVAEGNTVTVLRYYRCGTLLERGSFTGTKKHGKWTQFTENGAVAGEAHYTNGQPSGTWLFWYDNGQVRSQTEYSEGKPVEHTMWSMDGTELSYNN